MQTCCRRGSGTRIYLEGGRAVPPPPGPVPADCELKKKCLRNDRLQSDIITDRINRNSGAALNISSYRYMPPRISIVKCILQTLSAEGDFSEIPKHRGISERSVSPQTLCRVPTGIARDTSLGGEVKKKDITSYANVVLLQQVQLLWCYTGK